MIRSLAGGAALRLACSGPARSHPVRPVPVSWPWSAGSFFWDLVWNSSLKNLTGRDVRVLSPTAEAPHVRGRYKSPAHSPPSHPPPVNAFLPWYTQCSLRPHSSDPSSVPTRLTRSPRRLSVLSDVPCLPTRSSLCPRSRPRYQERPRPTCCPVSSLPPWHHPQHDVLSSSSFALVPVHGYDLLETQLTDHASFPSMHQAPPRSAEPGLDAVPRKHTSPRQTHLLGSLHPPAHSLPVSEHLSIEEKT